MSDELEIDEDEMEELEEIFGDISDDSNETLEFETEEGEAMYRSDGTRVGTVAYCPTYDCMAYLSPRHDTNHFHYNRQAFPIDKGLLLQMKEMGVEKVFIGLKVSKDVLEFDFEQYLECEDGEEFNEGHGVQRYTPRANLKREWPNAMSQIAT